MTRRSAGTETATVRAILQYLHLRGYPYRMGGVKGMADIIGCAPDTVAMTWTSGDQLLRHVPGRFFAIEVKSATGKPTPEQTAFLAAVVRAGGIAFLARSVKDVQEHGL